MKIEIFQKIQINTRAMCVPKKCQFDRDQGGMWKILVSKPYILESKKNCLEYLFIITNVL